MHQLPDRGTTARRVAPASRALPLVLPNGAPMAKNNRIRVFSGRLRGAGRFQRDGARREQALCGTRPPDAAATRPKTSESGCFLPFRQRADALRVPDGSRSRWRRVSTGDCASNGQPVQMFHVKHREERGRGGLRLYRRIVRSGSAPRHGNDHPEGRPFRLADGKAGLRTP